MAVISRPKKVEEAAMRERRRSYKAKAKTWAWSEKTAVSEIDLDDDVWKKKE
jgi:hypothetical protein